MAKAPHDPRRPEAKSVLDAVEAGDMDALRMALTARQRAFAHEYMVDRNGTAAAIRAGYATTYADRQAHQLLKHRGVATYIDHLTMSNQAQIVSVNPEYVINKTLEIINKEFAKDADKLRGLEMMARHLGMFIDKTEITGRDGEAIQIEQRRVQEEAESFTQLLDSLRRRAIQKEVEIV